MLSAGPAGRCARRGTAEERPHDPGRGGQVHAVGVGLRPADRRRLLDAYAAEVPGEGESSRSLAAAQEAAALAARLGDPGLRALTLVTLTRNLAALPDAAGRAVAADELIEIGDALDRPVYRWRGRFNRAFAAADQGDPGRARRLVGDSQDIARPTGCPRRSASATARWGCSLTWKAGPEEAERLYTEASAPMAGPGSLPASGFLWLATATIRLGQGRIAELAPRAADMLEVVGPVISDVLALALARDGRFEAAREMRGRAVPIRADFFQTLLSSFRAGP